MSDENITAATTSDYSLNPQLNYLGTKIRVEFKGGCSEVTNNNNNNSNYPTLKKCLFGAVSLTKNAELISINILDMELDLMDMDLIHIQAV